MHMILSLKSNSILHITRTPFVFCRHLVPSLTHIGRGQNKNICSPTFSLNQIWDLKKESFLKLSRFTHYSWIKISFKGFAPCYCNCNSVYCYNPLLVIYHFVVFPLCVSILTLQRIISLFPLFTALRCELTLQQLNANAK